MTVKVIIVYALVMDAVLYLKCHHKTGGNMEAAILYASVSIIAGLVLLLFGVRFMKVAVSIVGFLAGYWIVSGILASFGWSTTLVVVIALAAGTILAAYAFKFYTIAIRFSIAYFIGSLAYSIMQLTSAGGGTAFLVAVAVTAVAYILLEYVQFVELLFACITSTLGASLIVAGAYVLLVPGDLVIIKSHSMDIVAQAAGWWLIAWLALTIAGFSYQRRLFKKPEPSNNS